MIRDSQAVGYVGVAKFTSPNPEDDRSGDDCASHSLFTWTQLQAFSINPSLVFYLLVFHSLAPAAGHVEVPRLMRPRSDVGWRTPHKLLTAPNCSN